MSELRTITGIGRIIQEQHEVITRYCLYVDASGRATMIELLDRPRGLFSDQAVCVVFENGRHLHCQVLDDTPMCTVIGDP